MKVLVDTDSIQFVFRVFFFPAVWSTTRLDSTDFGRSSAESHGKEDTVWRKRKESTWTSLQSWVNGIVGSFEKNKEGTWSSESGGLAGLD